MISDNGVVIDFCLLFLFYWVFIDIEFLFIGIVKLSVG